MDWQSEAIDLKRQGLDSNAIAEAVGKSPSTVRKVIARAREAGTLPAEFAVVDVPPEDDPEYEAPHHEHDKPLPDDFRADLGDRDPLDEFKAEAGEAVGPMPPETPPEPGETEHALPVLKGTRQLALDLGPNAAPITESTVTFKSEKWPSGHFGMGDVVIGTFRARIVSTPGKEKWDANEEEFVAAPMNYGALITEISYEPAEDDE